MSKKKSIIEKIASGKGFYITAVLSFVVIVAAIAFVYNSSVNMLRDIDIPTTVKQVEKNQKNVSDPRQNEEVTDEISTQKSTQIAETTAVPTTKKVAETTTAQTTTQAAEVFRNDDFISPLTGDIDRAFSLSPVYDETMEDWRIHKGADFIAKRGDEVKSIGNGKVVRVISDPAWGYCIDVDYGDFVARYCGMEQGTTVIIDDVVTKGDIIGKVGFIPCESKQESHLHFEVVRGEAWVDPKEVIG